MILAQTRNVLIAFTALLTIFKLAGVGPVAAWSWFWVLAPLLAVIAYFIGQLVVVAIMAFGVAFLTKEHK